MTSSACQARETGASISIMMDSYACSVPKPGSLLVTDDLIAKADTIVLVRLESSNTKLFEITYLLKTVEVIKGKGEKSYAFSSHGSTKVSDNDFIGHTAQDFWNTPKDNKPNARSEFPCCICGPDHGFIMGRDYLYFPDKLGAMKSAEVIHSANDRWLQYVRAKVLAANNASQGTRKNNRAPELER